MTNIRTLAKNLWWFIENVNEDTLNRTDLFFTLREQYRNTLFPEPATSIACPCCGTCLTEAQIKSLWGAYCASKRTTPPKAGPGRPKKIKRPRGCPRCKSWCGVPDCSICEGDSGELCQNCINDLPDIDDGFDAEKEAEEKSRIS